MSNQATVVIVGAGPAALAAAHRLRTEPGVRVVLVAPGGTSQFPAGALKVATGDGTVEQYRARVTLDGVEVIPAAVEELGATGVRIDGRWIEAQAVIAAPGLAIEQVGGTQARGSSPPERRIVSFWDVDGAAEAAPAIEAFARGVLTVVVASPLYRCPPAPYGLAMRLAARADELGLSVRVRLTTTEPRPLAAIGSGVSEFLADACARSGVEVTYEWQPDHEALTAGEVVGADGDPLGTDLAVVVPPHHVHPLLADVAGSGPGAGELVQVDAHGRAANGVFVAGDVVASPFPRATAPAVVSGITAAEGALAGLGVDGGEGARLPEPDCFVDRGAGAYSRIQISYPDGEPPAGSSQVHIGEPEPAETGGFEEARSRWLGICGHTN